MLANSCFIFFGKCVSIEAFSVRCIINVTELLASAWVESRDLNRRKFIIFQLGIYKHNFTGKGTKSDF